VLLTRLATPAALALLLYGCAVIDNLRANVLDIEAANWAAAGYLDEAIRRNREALALRERLYGNDSAMVASPLSNLAGNFRSLGDYATARSLYARSVAIYDRTGARSFFLPSTLSAHADLLRMLGEYSAAQPLLERALKLREDRLGPNDPFIIPNLTNLARVYHEAGDYARARAVYERALGLAHRTFGLEYVEAHRLTDLGDLLLDMGDHAGARALYERVLEADLPPALRRAASYRLSLLCKRQKDFDRAVALWRQLLERDEGGPANGKVVLCEELAICYEHRLEAPETAAELTRRALALLGRIGNPTMNGRRNSEEFRARLWHRLARLTRKQPRQALLGCS